MGLEHARERTRQQGCSSWVSFQASKLDEFDTADQFDAIAGRYILLYQRDPGATIHHLLKFLKPDGIVVFHELDFAGPRSSDPPCAFWDEIYALLSEAFRRAGRRPITVGGWRKHFSMRVGRIVGSWVGIVYTAAIYASSVLS